MTISSYIFLGLILILCFLIFKKSKFYRPRNNTPKVEKPVVKIAKPNYNKKEETQQPKTNNDSKKFWE
jgi:hypothetical protein